MTESWTFAHVADMQVGSPRSFRFAPAWNRNWQTAKRQITEINPDLLLVGGDLTRDGSIHRYELADIRRDLDALPFPCHVIPGNMDAGNKHASRRNTHDPGRDDPALNVTAGQLDGFASVFGPVHWTFVHKNVRFSGIYAAVAGTGLKQEEEMWRLLEELGRVHRDPSSVAVAPLLRRVEPFHVAVMHYALFIDDIREPNFDIASPEEYHEWYFGTDEPHRGRLLRAFKDAGVDIVISGHIHCRRTDVVEGIRFVKAPATCMAQWRDKWPDGDPRLGFLRYDVSGSGIEETFVPLEEVSDALGYGPGGHPLPENRDYSLAWERPDEIVSVFDPAVELSDGWGKQTKRLSGFVPSMMPWRDGASLALSFSGTAVSLLRGSMWQVMDGVPGETYGADPEHPYPRPGRPVGGSAITVSLDGSEPRLLRLAEQPLEIPLAEDLPGGAHTLVVTSLRPSPLTVIGFRVLDRPWGVIRGEIDGEEKPYLNDVSVLIEREGTALDVRLARNPFSSEMQLWGLAPGAYDLTIAATGWETRRVSGVTVEAGKVAEIGDVKLAVVPLARRRKGVLLSPRRGAPAFVVPGGELDVRARKGAAHPRPRLALSSRLTRAELPVEETAAENDEVVIRCRVPTDVPDGLYHLDYSSGRETELAPQAVSVKRSYAGMKALRIVKFGHMDTWHERNAEYVRILVELSNLIGPDLLLVCNECNWQYVAGALGASEVPYMVTSGNHGMPGMSEWFGERISAARMGPVSVVTYNDTWEGDTAELSDVLNSTRDAAYRILLGVEPDIPVGFATDHGIDLYCFGHGYSTEKPEGAAWTHLGKEFHVVDVDLETKAASFFSGAGKRDEDAFGAPAKYPISRERPWHPVSFEPANDGTRDSVAATVRNPMNAPLNSARVRFLMPKGSYAVSAGAIVGSVESDDGELVKVEVAVDLQPRQEAKVVLTKR